MFGLKKKQKSDQTVVGVDPAQPGADRTVVQRRGSLIVYFDKARGWRWRLVAPNGKITADSGESYIRRYDATAAAKRLAGVAGSAVLEVRDR